MEKARILAVDDTPANLEVLEDLLRPEFRVSIATNGFDALRLVRGETPPDLVLLDIMMSGMDGYEVCRALKEDEATRHIPIIFVTAMSEMEDEEKGLALGAVDYITKPFSPAIVLARIRTHLSLYSQTRLLHQLVQERTAELENARDEAEAANKAKSAFLANMSHELRTPLNGIMGSTQILMSLPASEQQTTFFETAYDSAQHMLRMVNELLKLATVEVGDIELHPEAFSVHTGLADMLAYYEDQAKEKGLRFACTIEKTVPDVVYLDARAVRQVVMNLLNNALRYTPEGSIEFSVNAKGGEGSTRAECATLLFTVRDTGVGVAAELRKSIFEPFTIAEDYMTKKYSAAGLGLSISKRLVTMMGGHLWMTSELGKGSIFHFTVPCAPDALPADA